MTSESNKDSGLKKAVAEVLERCGLDDFVVDREVHLNFTGATDTSGQLDDEKEVDVIAIFSYAGKRVALFFECENSTGPGGSIRSEYRDYDQVLRTVRSKRDEIKVLHSKNGVLSAAHFEDVEDVRLCFVYGLRYPDRNLKTCVAEAKKYSFTVWGDVALRYFLALSSSLGTWTKYELFREMRLDFEQHLPYSIPAIEVRQKRARMYVGTIHPGQLLRIAYVTRRARQETYAYQRMLSSHRIKEIASFISSNASEAFLPNAAVVVFDDEPAIQRLITYDREKRLLNIPRKYCSAWIIDGQHRVYGFVGTQFEEWTDERFQRFDLPIVIFRRLKEISQTKTFITINYNQKKIKSELLCDLSTMTGDLRQRLTWASAIGKELNRDEQSPLYQKVGVTELDSGRPISLASVVQYGLLETLLGFKPGPTYSGPLCKLGAISSGANLHSADNQRALGKQTRFLIYFLKCVRANTSSAVPQKDPWTNTRQYALLRPTGINALFMVLARILEKYPRGTDFADYLKPLRKVRFRRNIIKKMGGGWGGFRELANRILRKLNAAHGDGLRLYGIKETT